MRQIKTLIALISFELLSQGQQRPVHGGARFENPEHPTDVRDFGAICDGTTNIQPAVAAAIAAGNRHLFFPANCKWIPAGDAVPQGVDITGEDWVSSKIETSIPQTADLILKKDAIIRNVAVHARFCIVGPDPPNVDKWCPVGYAANISNADVGLSSWPYQSFWAAYGPHNDARDVPGMAIIQSGPGDGIFLANEANGVSLRVWPIGTGGSGILVQNGVDPKNDDITHSSPITGSIGIKVNNHLNDTGSAGIAINRGGNSVGMLINDQTATTGVGLQLLSGGGRTSGNFLNIFHQNSAYQGSALIMNLGGGAGSFTGNFLDLRQANQQRLAVDAQGKMLFGGITFSALGRAAAGVLTWCADCTPQSNPCVGGGAGAWAFGVSTGTWNCPF